MHGLYNHWDDRIDSAEELCIFHKAANPHFGSENDNNSILIMGMKITIWLILTKNQQPSTYGVHLYQHFSSNAATSI